MAVVVVGKAAVEGALVDTCIVAFGVDTTCRGDDRASCNDGGKGWAWAWGWDRAEVGAGAGATWVGLSVSWGDLRDGELDLILTEVGAEGMGRLE